MFPDQSLSQPTPYPDVNQVLSDLLSGAQAVLGEHFTGMYLYGSLALGDFNPHASDIDFVVVTGDALTDEHVRALQALHARIAAGNRRWATELEGSYIPQHDLRRYDPARARHPHIFQGRLAIEQHGVHWIIERHVLREQGVVLAGPAPRTLIDPIAPNELRRAVAALVASWWAPMAGRPARLNDRKHQIYAVLTMCRVLYTLDHGTVVSKPVAAAWARAALEPRWRLLIDRSLATTEAAPRDAVNETCAFIRYTDARCKEYQVPS